MSAAVEEMPMNQRTPADPPPAVGKKGLSSAFAPDLYVRTGESPADLGADQSSAEPKRSFFRGIAVGLAIMIPIWTWLIIRLLH
jgi:hypothetical protein